MANSRARVLAHQQWAQHKTYIVKLYLEKKYTLKVVQEKLAKQGFHATEGQLRTRLKLWGIRKPRRGTGVTVADVSTGQNDDNPLTGDASFDEDDVAPALQTVEDSQRSESTVMGSQPTFEERDHAFLVNPAIASEELYPASPQIVEPSSFRTTYDLVGTQPRASQGASWSTHYGLVGNEARASQAPSYSTRYGLIGNDTRTSQVPSYNPRHGLVDNETGAYQSDSYSPRYGLVDNETRTSQAPPSFQYHTSGSEAQYQVCPFGLEYETSDGHSGYSLGLSAEQYGETLPDELCNLLESIDQQGDAGMRYG